MYPRETKSLYQPPEFSTLIGGHIDHMWRDIPKNILPDTVIADLKKTVNELKPHFEKSSRGWEMNFDAANVKVVKGALRDRLKSVNIPTVLCETQQPLTLSQAQAAIETGRLSEADASTLTQELAACSSYQDLVAIVENTLPRLRDFSARWYDNWEGVRNSDHTAAVARNYALLPDGEQFSWQLGLIFYLHDLGGKAVVGKHHDQEEANAVLAETVVQTLQLAPQDATYIMDTVTAMIWPYLAHAAYQEGVNQVEQTESAQKYAHYQQLIIDYLRKHQGYVSAQANLERLFNLWTADGACYTFLGGGLPSFDAQFTFTVNDSRNPTIIRLEHRQEIEKTKTDIKIQINQALAK